MRLQPPDLMQVEEQPQQGAAAARLQRAARLAHRVRVRAETLTAACAMRNAPSYRILGFPSTTVSRKFWRNKQHSKE